MKICFVLPGFSRTPIGGYKMVYEYANRLSRLGYDITVVSLNNNKMKQFHLPESLRRIAVNMENKWQPKWFELDEGVKKISGEKKNYLNEINDSDVVVATGIQTVETVKNNFMSAKKLYFIQGYENWNVTEEYLHRTYGYGFYNIVVSAWLKKIVDQYSKTPSMLLKNPIDTNIYKAVSNQTERLPHTIGVLYHTEENKGLKYALDAIYRLKEKYMDLSVEMFGMFSRPKDLPEWIHYKKSASQKETIDIYNKVRVFLCASIEEGYGLTGMEAMACGACLVSTSYKGVLEYAKNGYNALLSPVKDVDALVNNVSKLFDDEKMRELISKNGIDSVRELSWEPAVDKLVGIIKRPIG